jgi:hypothetical protein
MTDKNKVAKIFLTEKAIALVVVALSTLLDVTLK